MRKNHFQLDTPGPEDMKKLIGSLSPSERAILADPDFITEDEADLISSDRSMAEGGPLIDADEVFARHGLSKRSAKV